MMKKNLKHLSMEDPTNRPSDRNKLPDLVDFCVTKGIPQDFAVAKPCFDLSSDHSPVSIILTTGVLNEKKQPSSSNRYINWDEFRCLTNEILTLNLSLNTVEDTEAAVSSSTTQ
jgi:hypothetical protein